LGLETKRAIAPFTKTIDFPQKLHIQDLGKKTRFLAKKVKAETGFFEEIYQIT